MQLTFDWLWDHIEQKLYSFNKFHGIIVSFSQIEVLLESTALSVSLCNTCWQPTQSTANIFIIKPTLFNLQFWESKHSRTFYIEILLGLTESHFVRISTASRVTLSSVAGWELSEMKVATTGSVTSNNHTSLKLPQSSHSFTAVLKTQSKDCSTFIENWPYSTMWNENRLLSTSDLKVMC